MPTYEYECPKCGTIQEVVHSIKSDPVVYCPACEGEEVEMVRLISGGAGFVLGSTETMGWREKRQRMKRNAKLELRQMERYGSEGTPLVPNVGGEVTGSWSDAAKLAKEKGKDSLSYARKVYEERHTSKESGVNDKKWKAAKDKADKA